MIIRKELENGLVKTYSDKGFYIIKKGTHGKFISAIDSPLNNSVYLETVEKIKNKEYKTN